MDDDETGTTVVEDSQGWTRRRVASALATSLLLVVVAAVTFALLMSRDPSQGAGAEVDSGAVADDGQAHVHEDGHVHDHGDGAGSTGTPVEGPPPSGSGCGEPAAQVPGDLADRTAVGEVTGTGPPGVRVTFNEPSLAREVTLISGSDPIAFSHGEPTGARRSETTVGPFPAVRVDLPSGDRFLYWEDPSAPAGCEGMQVVAVGLTEEEFQQVLATVTVQ